MLSTRNLFIAEFFGTFCLLFAGCSAIVVDDLYGGVISHVGISIVFGLVVLAMIYTIGDISGAHINPAVTLGFWKAGRLEGRHVPVYIAAQLSGAITAIAILKIIFPSHSKLAPALLSG